MERGELAQVTTLDRSEQSRVHFSDDDTVLNSFNYQLTDKTIHQIGHYNTNVSASIFFKLFFFYFK